MLAIDSLPLFPCFCCCFETPSPGCPGTHYVYQAGRELTEIPLCLPRVGIKGVFHCAQLGHCLQETHLQEKPAHPELLCPFGDGQSEVQWGGAAVRRRCCYWNEDGGQSSDP